MAGMTDVLRTDPALAADGLVQALVPVLEHPTGTSKAGHPYLEREAWETFRDRVPHILGAGLAVHEALDRIVVALRGGPGGSREDHPLPTASSYAEGGTSYPDEATLPADLDNVARAIQVCRQVVNTAIITAPPDLWLTRHVLGFLADLGLTDRLLEGSAIYPDACRVGGAPLHEPELDKDLRFLLSRGIVDQYDNGFRIAGHPRVRRLLEDVRPLPAHIPAGISAWWRALFSGDSLTTDQIDALLDVSHGAARRDALPQNHWIADLDDVQLAYRLVPLVLGLRAADRCRDLVDGARVTATDWSPTHPACAGASLEVLIAAGWMRRQGDQYVVTRVGARGFSRGPGPFGIIETYHPYMTHGRDILERGPGRVWVQRGENVGASQDANRTTFRRANDALDRFCAATGFEYALFIEHAIGRGEATRQRFERSGDTTISYVGADLEDAALEAARDERSHGRLPAAMKFVQSDIGGPDALIEALRGHGLDPDGAVMLVGNGFHEVRQQTDDGMVDVFRGYHDAGIVLLFTEESALSIDDLRATAWNTYHAGFKYVHEKSGQGLRPADPRPQPRLGHPLRAAWSECARRAGYVRASAFCSRTRTIYPYPPPSGYNPSISVSHFFVPASLADRLGISEAPTD